MSKIDMCSTSQADFRNEICSIALSVLLPASFLVGMSILFIGGSSYYAPRTLILLLALLVLPVLVWGLYAHGKELGLLFFSFSYIFMIFLSIYWLRIPEIFCLSVIPVGLTMFTFGRGPSLLLALMISVPLLVGDHLLPTLGGGSRLVVLVVIWGAQGFLLLSLRCAEKAIVWSNSRYEAMREELELARDQRFQFKQTQEDLIQTNQELTRVSNRLEAMKRIAEEARRAKQEFVANVRHELRTPMNMIIGFSEMILEAPHTYGGKIPPALLADLRVIFRNAKHLASMVDDVLDMSQIEVGRWALIKKHVSLADLGLEAMDIVQPLFDSKGLYLITEIADHLPKVFCDPTRTREVLVNILANAGRFTDEGGVHLRVWQEKDNILVEIEDTGPGIAPEDQDRIFKPFEQLDQSLSKSQGGTGLGLSISKAFVELHGGKMWFESEEGCGTSFFFQLPIDPPFELESSSARWFNLEGQKKSRSKRAAVPYPVVSPRFVAMEEGKTFQRLLNSYMDDVDIASVGNLDEAIEELERMPAWALLVNASPVTEALTELRSISLPYNTPAIVCSLPDVRDVARDLGVVDYLVKPITREVLLGAVEKVDLKNNTILIVDDELSAIACCGLATVFKPWILCEQNVRAWCF